MQWGRVIVVGLLATLPGGCAVEQQSQWLRWETGQPADALVRAIRASGGWGPVGSSLVFVEYQPVGHTEDWFVARMDWDRSWWGTFEVLQWRDGRLEQYATFAPPGIETSNYIDEVGSVLPEGWSDPIVYAIDSTHQGNQSLYLLRLDPVEGVLHVLCKARIALNFTESTYRLDWRLSDVDADGHVDLVLSGRLRQHRTGSAGTMLDKPTGTVRKVYLWQPNEKRFALSRMLSVGVESWDDRDTGY